MAGGKGDYLEDEIMDHIFGIGSWTAPATVKVHLYTVTPSDTGGGTEVSGGSYAAVEVDNDGVTWSSVAGTVSNSIDIEFPEATGDWGTVVAFAIKQTTGELLYWGPVTPNKAVNTGDTAKFIGGAPGEIVITED